MAADMARMTDGCAIAKLGNTQVLATAVCSRERGPISSFVPLQVDYRQKYAAAGRIPMNYRRRDVGQSIKETLTSRAIDRCMRPLFPKGFSSEIQISCTPIAFDHVNDPDILSINAASAALTLSTIPWNGPIGAVRIGIIGDEIVINPPRKSQSKIALNMILAVTAEKQVVMMEGSGNHVTEEKFLEAVETGTEAAQLVINSINELSTRAGKKKETHHQPLLPPDIIEAANLFCEVKATELFQDHSLDEVDRAKMLEDIIQEVIVKLKENFAQIDLPILYEIMNTVIRQSFRNVILEHGRRCDGRGPTDLRDISIEVNKYETLHGCSLFERGQTQVFSTVALDSIESAIRSDPYFDTPTEEDKAFILHYEFPPYATNEIGRLGKFGRREVGHGSLAESSLRPVIPSGYPFTIRLTSEVLASNGSSSMASVCGGSLALMDAGVPISTPIAGVAMGLVSQSGPDKGCNETNFQILSDISAMEDYHGDMDFKIAGSKDGITAMQLDVKVPGLPIHIIRETLYQAKEAKLQILHIMNGTISKPREERKKSWPVSENIEIPLNKVRHFVGQGGKNLRTIYSKTGVRLVYKEKGTFYLFAPNSEAHSEAKEMIEELISEKKLTELILEKVYSATIVELQDDGIMITLFDGMEPVILRNSILSSEKVTHPSDLGLQVGQKIDLQYFGKNPTTGELRLYRKSLRHPL